MADEWCAVCGFYGTDVDRHIGRVGDVIRGREYTQSFLGKLVDHRLQLEMVR